MHTVQRNRAGRKNYEKVQEKFHLFRALESSNNNSVTYYPHCI